MREWEYKVVALEEKSGGHGHIINAEEEEKRLTILALDPEVDEEAAVGVAIALVRVGRVILEPALLIQA